MYDNTKSKRIKNVDIEITGAEKSNAEIDWKEF